MLRLKYSTGSIARVLLIYMRSETMVRLAGASSLLIAWCSHEPTCTQQTMQFLCTMDVSCALLGVEDKTVNINIPSLNMKHPRNQVAAQLMRHPCFYWGHKFSWNVGVEGFERIKSMIGLIPKFGMPRFGKCQMLASDWFVSCQAHKNLPNFDNFWFTKCWHQTNQRLTPVLQLIMPKRRYSISSALY